jgi:uncharacterized protein YecE (DUF72 family)
MTFGKLDIETYVGLEESYFKLMATEQPNLPGKKSAIQKMYIGLPKWGRTEWVGKLFPANTKEKDFLLHYAATFNTIELNATHYKLYGPENIIKWLTATDINPDFRFCPKFYQGITHRGPVSYSSKAALTNSFLDGIKHFGNKLGPAYIQVTDKYSQTNKDELFEYIQNLPSWLKVNLEVRHESWYQSAEIIANTTTKLKQLKTGWVITDVPGIRNFTAQHLTTPEAFIRFGSQGNHRLDRYRIDQWKEVLKEWYQHGLEKCWFFVHSHDESAGIDFAFYVQEQLNALVPG